MCVFLIIKLFTLEPDARPSYRQDSLGAFMAVILIIQALVTLVYLIYSIIRSVVWFLGAKSLNLVQPSSMENSGIAENQNKVNYSSIADQASDAKLDVKPLSSTNRPSANLGENIS